LNRPVCDRLPTVRKAVQIVNHPHPAAHPAVGGMLYVVGIDPGGRDTGLVAGYGRYPDTLTHAGHTLVRRPNEPLLAPSPAALTEVIAAAHTLLSAAPESADQLLVAVEGLHAPNPHIRVTDPSGIMATAIVWGAILGTAWPCPLLTVPPGRNGSAPSAAYPAPLRQAAGGRGRDNARHLRSAWDVAVVGAAMWRREHRYQARR
jgi:hypothetical protein